MLILNKTKLTLALICFFVAPATFAKAPQAGYQTTGVCDGLPKIAVDTPTGFCVGLVVADFKFTRGIAPLPNGDLLVVDMGSWDANKGSVWLLKKTNQADNTTYEKTRIINNIDRPNGIAIGPDKKIYVGAIDRIFRFSLDNPAAQEDVIGGKSGTAALPTSGLHPLKQMIFDHDNNLFVNIGSETNVCSKGKTVQDANKVCAETQGDNPRSTLRKYTMQWPAGKVTGMEIYASGLRNSMALAIHPKTGDLWQGENSRDSIASLNAALKDAEFPHDEINLINKGKNYGWPYCYDHNLPNPEFAKADCSKFTAPEVLLPAHAAPLAMFFNTSESLPSPYRQSLIVGFHGYRETGHRLMAYPLNDQGKPSGTPWALIDGWGNKKGTPMGAPVDVKMGADGAIYITEDRNGTILRLINTDNTGKK